jgi:hypothetical protein
VLRSACKLSLEGIVSKRADGRYRSDGQLDEGKMPRRTRSSHRRLERDRQ